MLGSLTAFYSQLYGMAGVDFGSLTLMYFGGTSGLVFNGNPTYTVSDFIRMYPKFAGPPSNFSTVGIQLGSPVVTGFVDVSSFSVGQLIKSSSFSDDTLILSVDGTNKTITLTSNALANDTSITVYTKPMLPVIVLKTYVTLAAASIMIGRYFEAWPLCMALYIAHMATLYMRTESGPNSTASQVASSGLTKGILIHRAAGDVSATSKLVEGQEDWGAWTETEYGVQFIGFAISAGAGPLWVR